MTSLDDYWPPVEPREAPETPRRHRHVWVRWTIDDNGVMTTKTVCEAHAIPVVRDEARARRGKTSRNRGNAYEREVAAKLGGRRVGQYGDQVDVDVPGYLRVQTKNGGTYPRLIDRWLRAIPIEAGLLRAVVLGDAPGPGTRRRSLIVFDLDEYAMWHGKP